MQQVALLSRLFPSRLRVLIPLQNDSGATSAAEDIARCLDLTFCTDPVDATLKALGV